MYVYERDHTYIHVRTIFLFLFFFSLFSKKEVERKIEREIPLEYRYLQQLNTLGKQSIDQALS